jgi:hypothetical protein
MKRAFVVESETMIVPFAPPSEDQVTNGAPCGFRPEAVVMLRMPCVPTFSGVVVILKLIVLLPLELFIDWTDSKRIMYCLFGSYSDINANWLVLKNSSYLCDAGRTCLI